MNPETRFPFSDRFPFGERSQAAIGGSGGGDLSPGFYYIGNGSSITPIAITDPRWAVTGKFQDVGLNDHTTYESSSQSASVEWIHGLRVFASSTPLNQWTASVYGESSTSLCYYSSDGTNWNLWGTPPNNSIGFVQQWFDIGDLAPGAINAKYIQIVHEDSTTFSEQGDARIGDWRLS